MASSTYEVWQAKNQAMNNSLHLIHCSSSYCISYNVNNILMIPLNMFEVKNEKKYLPVSLRRSEA